MKATNCNHKDVVESLLAGNANPNIIDKVVCVNWGTLTTAHRDYFQIGKLQETGRSALFMATERNNLEIVEILIEGGASVDVKDKVFIL